MAAASDKIQPYISALTRKQMIAELREKGQADTSGQKPLEDMPEEMLRRFYNERRWRKGD